jgi:hypothetical protein
MERKAQLVRKAFKVVMVRKELMERKAQLVRKEFKAHKDFKVQEC